jgi:UPF0755 protein
MRKFLVTLVILLAVAGVVSWFIFDERLHQPYKGYEGLEQFVQVPAGTATPEIGRILVRAGIVRDEMAFRAALWWTGRSRRLQAGEYRFDHPLSPIDVIDQLARGEIYARRITFPEGLTIPEMAAIYDARGFGPANSFLEAARNEMLVRDLDPGAPDLEGYLFPDTYALPRGAPADRLVSMMVERFRHTFAELRSATEADQGFSTRQILTLASLVEKETGKAEERPIVAAVYRNRLKIGMGLQADPTVVYALQVAGRYTGNIKKTDLSLDSPYNTYRYPGLPPGPIAAPGRASIEAALMPSSVRYLYFVSRNDGSHVFAETLAEHNRNVRQYQVLYFRR